MRSRRTTIAATLLAAIMALAVPYIASAQGGSPFNPAGLSPYWSPNVSRWESLILPVAQERSLDPDLIAAIIWKESLGRAWERGPVGAVGLMGVMPFEWRPSPEELENPWTNIAWGARALAHTIRDGKGDLYYALAAYNGGWDKIHLRVTRNYATDVLNHYARAVAMRYELPADGNWVAIFAADSAPYPQTITVLGPQRPLARYTERPWVQASIPTVPSGAPPHSTVITFVDEYGVEHKVNLWLVAADSSTLPSHAMQAMSPLSTTRDPGNERASGGISLPITTPTIAPTQPPVPQDTPTPVPAATAAVPVPTAVPPTPSPTPTPPTECAGGPLQISAWDLSRVRAPDGGWTATIYVQGHGGDCLYTYAWEGEVIADPMPGPFTFEIHQTDLFAVTMGTVSVTSAGETVGVGLFLKTPAGDGE